MELKVTHDPRGWASSLGLLARHGERVPVALERVEGLLVEHLQETPRLRAAFWFFRGWDTSRICGCCPGGGRRVDDSGGFPSVYPSSDTTIPHRSAG